MVKDPLQNLDKGATTEDTIRRLLQLLCRTGGEGLNETAKIEGKSNLVDGGDKKSIWDMARDVAAMANAPGGDGHSLYGVEQKPGDRKYNPQRRPLDSADITNVLRERCYPAPTFYYREETVDGELYGWLHVPKSGSRPHCWKEKDGQWDVLTRDGARIVRANREELDEMYGATVGAIQDLLAALGSERLPGATSPADRMKVNNWWLPADLQDYPAISWATAVLAPKFPASPLLDIYKLSDASLQESLRKLISDVESAMTSARMFGPGSTERRVGEDYLEFYQRRGRDGCPVAQLRTYADGLISYGRLIGNEHSKGQIGLITVAIVPHSILQYAKRFLDQHDKSGAIDAYSFQMAVHLSREHKSLVDEGECPIPELTLPVIVPSTPRKILRSELGEARDISIQLVKLFERIVKAAGDGSRGS